MYCTLGSILFGLAAALSYGPTSASEPASTGQGDGIGLRLSWGDFTADGLADVYAIDSDGSDRLYRNAGDGSFEDITLEAGLPGTLCSVSASWADFDLDGLQDLYVVAARVEHRLLRNAGDGTFQDATRFVGLDDLFPAESVTWSDYDGDGFPDLIFVGDSGERVFHNAEGERFEAVTLGRPLRQPSTARRSLISGTAEGAEPAAETPRSIAGETAGSAGTGATAQSRLSTRRGHLPPRALRGSSSLQLAPPILPVCPQGVDDVLLSGSQCIPASNTATLGHLYPMSSTLFVDSTNARVGIGTTAPTEKLMVSGGRICPSGTGTNSGIQFSHLHLFEDTDATLKLTSAGGYDVALMPDGNVGIGKVMPMTKLDVNGNLTINNRITSPSGDLHLSSGGSPAGIDLFDGVKNHVLGVFAGNTETVRLDSAGVSWIAGGNFGVGVSDATARLHARRDGQSSTPVARFENLNNNHINNPIVTIKHGRVLNTAVAIPLEIRDGADNLVATIRGDGGATLMGNVGIAAPSSTNAKLTVGGDIQLSAGAIKFADGSVQTSAAATGTFVYKNANTSVDLPTIGAWTTVISQAITVPGPGTVYVSASGFASLNGAGGSSSGPGVSIGISSVSNGPSINQPVRVFLQESSPYVMSVPCFTQHCYQVASAGTVTLYLVAKRETGSSSNTVAQVTGTQMFLQFLPQ